MASCLRPKGYRAAVLLTVLGGSLAGSPGRAAIIIDPRPPFRWEEMLGCEVAVLARYKAHQGNRRLSLEVVRTLKGKVRPGDVLSVTLDHWYSVETGPGVLLFRGGKADGSPRLCYKEQIMNPGPAVPVPILKDVREPAVYFLPRAGAPALVRRGQVQPRALADGWQQALDHRPMDLLFRLTQNVSPAVSRDALEELHLRRDPRVLDKLFAWLLVSPFEDRQVYRPVQAEYTLLALGDRDGDVYERALARFTDEARDGIFSRRRALGRILVRADRERAWRDLDRLIEAGPPAVRCDAVECLGDLADERALERALKLLNDPDLGPSAASALGALTRAPGRPRLTCAEAARFRARVRARLRALLASPAAAAPDLQKRCNGLRQLFEEPPALDLARAEKVLLDPNEKCYHGWAIGAAHEVYASADHHFDPRLVPLLARVVRDVPAVRKGPAYAYDVVVRYAATCPNAFRAELVRLKLDQAPDFRKATTHELLGRLAVDLEMPATLKQLHEMYGRCGPGSCFRARRVPAALLAELRQQLDRGLADDGGPASRDVELLLQIDRTEGRRVLEQAAARCDGYEPHIRTTILALAVKHGHKEHLDRLLQEAADSDLLVAEDDRALARYLQLLDKGRKLSTVENWEYVHYEKGEVMPHYLFPTHATAFFARVVALLDSKSRTDRHEGVDLLGRALHWDFGLDTSDFEAVWAEKRRRLRPLLRRLAGMSEAEMRVTVLGELGVKLDGEPGPDWAAPLTDAALLDDPLIAYQALWLLEEVAAVPGCVWMHTLSAPEREKVLHARLRDWREGQPCEARLSGPELESLWADLAGTDFLRAYRAGGALIAAPRDSVPFLRERLRPVSAAHAARAARLIAELDHPKFRVREKATQELRGLREAAAPFLRRALAGSPSLETRRRVEKLRTEMESWSAERLRIARSVDILEGLGSREARPVLRALAGGVPEAFATREAQAALRRLIPGRGDLRP